MRCGRAQVLGGAGPAIAAVPLVVVWAGGSTINLLQGISRGQVGALGSASRIGFVMGMSAAQVRLRVRVGKSGGTVKFDSVLEQNLRQ